MVGPMLIEQIIHTIKTKLRVANVKVVDEVLATIVPGTDVDVLSFLFIVNTLFNDASADMQHKMKGWSLKQWVQEVELELSQRKITPPAQPGVVPPPATTPKLPKPAATSPKPIPPPVGGMPSPSTAPALPIPAPPTYLTPVEREAWIQARVRGGEFARGLGNYIEESTGTLVRETWGKEVAKIEADPKLRFQKIEQIRVKTADSVARHKTADELASNLRLATEEWGRNWGRIAKTELQGAYNEATVIEAIRLYGPDGLVARPPENGACVHCKALLLNSDGTPKIFNVEDLINNGTNVGKKSSQWKATVWPIHPNCRCGTQIVPEGFVFDNDWSLIRSNR